MNPARDGIVIDPTPLFDISPYLYMQFFEPLGSADPCAEAASDYDTDDWRRDLVDVTRDLAPGVIRWGGILSRYYKWREGVGRAERRPLMRNYAWGARETNRIVRRKPPTGFPIQTTRTTGSASSTAPGSLRSLEPQPAQQQPDPHRVAVGRVSCAHDEPLPSPRGHGEDHDRGGLPRNALDRRLRDDARAARSQLPPAHRLDHAVVCAPQRQTGVAVASAPSGLDIAAGMAVTGGRVFEIAPEDPCAYVNRDQRDTFAPVEKRISLDGGPRRRFPARSVRAVELEIAPA